MAAELGIEYGEDQIVDLNAEEAISQLEKVKEYNPDWVWLGGTLNSCAVIVRDAGRIGLDAKFIINTWGIDERFFDKAGDYAEGRAYGIFPVVVWNDSVPGMKDIMEAHSIYRSADIHTIHYVKGWLSTMIMAEGLKKAGGELSGPALRKALETLNDYDTGGLSAPITFTEDDHRPNLEASIYRIEGGKCKKVTDVEMPREDRFLGW